MKKALKYYLGVILTFSLAIIPIFAQIEIPQHTNNFYINDFANILSESTENKILNESVKLFENTTSQLVVTTVNGLDGHTIEEYAIEMARQWKIGSDKNNGILVLVSKNDRKIRIEVGYGLEGAINDGKAGRMIREYAKPYLSDNDFDNGIMNLFNAISSEVYTEYGVDVPKDIKNKVKNKVENFNDNDFDIESIIFIIILLLLFLPKISGGRLARIFPWLVIFNQNSRNHWDNDNDNNPFGGFGGGFGGSGGSDFGDFGGFDGGGGDFGGGGASSDF